jgi:hypothetical protein
VRLLDRGPHGVEPTIYAEALLKRGDVVFEELRQRVNCESARSIFCWEE